MLRDEDIELLVDEIALTQKAYETEILILIARRIRAIGLLDDDELFDLAFFMATEKDLKRISELQDSIAKKQEKKLKKLIVATATLRYAESKHLYDYRGLKQTPINKHVKFQQIITDVENEYTKAYRASVSPQAFMLRDPIDRTKLIPTTLSEGYKKIINQAVSAVRNDKIDYKSAMHYAVKDLQNSGIRRVVYEPESGRIFTQRADTAVRRNAYDAIRAISQDMQLQIGEEIGADGYELTVHEFPALDHEPIQGHQLSIDEFNKMQTGQSFVDYEGTKFSGFDRAIGTLNCRHFVYSIILGVSKPIHSQKELDNIIKRNHNGYELSNGKKITMYECTQYQRRLETKIRYDRDGIILAENSGDTIMKNKYEAQLAKHKSEYSTFSKACGLAPKWKRTMVC